MCNKPHTVSFCVCVCVLLCSSPSQTPTHRRTVEPRNMNHPAILERWTAPTHHLGTVVNLTTDKPSTPPHGLDSISSGICIRNIKLSEYISIGEEEQGCFQHWCNQTSLKPWSVVEPQWEQDTHIAAWWTCGLRQWFSKCGSGTPKGSWRVLQGVPGKKGKYLVPRWQNV